MSLRKIIAVTACGGVLVVSSFAADPAQKAQNNANQQQQAAGQVGQRTQWNNSDHMLASCVAIGNQEEVAINKFAEQKAKSQEVKDFAKMMVKDHQDFLQKLQRFAPEASREGYLMDESSADASRRTSSTQPANQNRLQIQGSDVNVKTGNIQQTAATKDDGQAQQVQHIDFMALHRELAENCLRQAKQGMSKKEGSEFDQCFIGHQIVKHEEMKNVLTVFARHTSGDLHQIFADGLATTEKHLQRAEEIMKKLNQSSAPSRS